MSSVAPRPRAVWLAPLTVIAVAITALLPTADASAAQAPIPLGTASSFAVLAYSGITNHLTTTILGDTGSSPTTSETGFGPGVDNVVQAGVDHDGDSVTQGAKVALANAYTIAAGLTPNTVEPAADLTGKTLVPGVYSGP